MNLHRYARKIGLEEEQEPAADSVQDLWKNEKTKKGYLVAHNGNHHDEMPTKGKRTLEIIITERRNEKEGNKDVVRGSVATK